MTWEDDLVTHDGIWQGITHLAEYMDLSCSGLARSAGLDPTSFNKSKRITRYGKPRWPSTASIAKVLNYANLTLAEFGRFVPEE